MNEPTLLTPYSSKESNHQSSHFHFIPKKYEILYLLISLLLIPYTLGTLFILFYIFQGDKELFLAVDMKHFVLFSWAIGYEIVSFFALLYLSFIQIFFKK